MCLNTTANTPLEHRWIRRFVYPLRLQMNMYIHITLFHVTENATKSCPGYQLSWLRFLANFLTLFRHTYFWQVTVASFLIPVYFLFTIGSFCWHVCSAEASAKRQISVDGAAKRLNNAFCSSLLYIFLCGSRILTWLASLIYSRQTQSRLFQNLPSHFSHFKLMTVV
jgi:hypothetical protein